MEKITDGTEICPKCNSSWVGESIFENFKKQRDEGANFLRGKTDEEIDNIVKETYSPPYNFGRKIGIEIRGKYDGVSYWVCPDCNAVFDRFTGEILEGKVFDSNIGIVDECVDCEEDNV